MSFLSAIPLIGSLIGAIKSAWERYNEQKQAEHETRLKLEQGKQQLIDKQIEYEHKLSIAHLKSTPPWFKMFTFMAWFLPYLIIIVLPEFGLQVFQNLALAPLWYVQTMQVLLFAVWGVAVSRDTVTGIFANLSAYWTKKLKKPQVVLQEGSQIPEAVVEKLKKGEIDVILEAPKKSK